MWQVFTTKRQRPCLVGGQDGGEGKEVKLLDITNNKMTLSPSKFRSKLKITLLLISFLVVEKKIGPKISGKKFSDGDLLVKVNWMMNPSKTF